MVVRGRNPVGGERAVHRHRDRHTDRETCVHETERTYTADTGKQQ